MRRSTGMPGRTREERKPVFYLDTPPVSRVLSRWLREHRDQPLEQKAGGQLRRLGDPAAREASLAELARLDREGSALAAYCLGVARCNGEILPEDRDEARRLFERAAGRNFPLAFEELAKAGEAGSDLLEKGALAGSARCSLACAGEFLAGRAPCGPGETEKIAGLLLRDARRGSWKALALFLEIFDRPCADFLREETKSAGWSLLRTAARTGLPQAMWQLGLRLRNEEGRELLSRAWERGFVPAGVSLALDIFHRSPEDEAWTEKATGILEEACRRGNARACALYGQYLAHLEEAKGFDLLREAARLGEPAPLADLLLGAAFGARGSQLLRDLMYEFEVEPLASAAAGKCRLGQFCMTDLLEPCPERGMALLREAAEEGFGPACGLLADILALGLYGRAPDREQALRWAEKGLRLGDPRSVWQVVFLTAEMPEGQAKHGEKELLDLAGWADRRRDLCARTRSLVVELALLDATRPKKDDVEKALDRLAEEVMGIHARARQQGDVAALAFLVAAFCDGTKESLLRGLARRCRFSRPGKNGESREFGFSSPARMALFFLKALQAAGDGATCERLRTRVLRRLEAEEDAGKDKES